MKTLFAVLTILIFTNTTFAQFIYIIDFDSPNSMNHYIEIDTISNPNNIWQIGVPDKIVFDSAYSLTHAIVTDTLNPYPVSDTSSFLLRHIRPGNPGGVGNWSLQLNFWFRFNSDSITDYGMVEASFDNGVTWINLLTEDMTYNLIWMNPKPILTGNSNGWQYFSLDLHNLTYSIGYSDTLLYRFTFISDSNQTNKDGWMLDDFTIEDLWEGIYEFENNNFIKVYPNPSDGNITIENNLINYNKSEVLIYNQLGEIVIKENLHSNKMKLVLPSGVYCLKLKCGESYYIKKLIIEK